MNICQQISVADTWNRFHQLHWDITILKRHHTASKIKGMMFKVMKYWAEFIYPTIKTNSSFKYAWIESNFWLEAQGFNIWAVDSNSAESACDTDSDNDCNDDLDLNDNNLNSINDVKDNNDVNNNAYIGLSEKYKMRK